MIMYTIYCTIHICIFIIINNKYYPNPSCLTPDPWATVNAIFLSVKRLISKQMTIKLLRYSDSNEITVVESIPLMILCLIWIQDAFRRSIPVPIQSISMDYQWNYCIKNKSIRKFHNTPINIFPYLALFHYVSSI
jgi:hypothetical protein